MSRRARLIVLSCTRNPPPKLGEKIADNFMLSHERGLSSLDIGTATKLKNLSLAGRSFYCFWLQISIDD